MVLADNVDGGDDLDLVVTTMNGMVYCFQTSVTYHPLKVLALSSNSARLKCPGSHCPCCLLQAWPSQNQGRNVFFPRFGHEGIFLRPTSHEYRDISRDFFKVQFDIVDSRAAVQQATAPKIGPYQVSVRKALVLKS